MPSRIDWAGDLATRPSNGSSADRLLEISRLMGIQEQLREAPHKQFMEKLAEEKAILDIENAHLTGVTREQTIVENDYKAQERARTQGLKQYNEEINRQTAVAQLNNTLLEGQRKAQVISDADFKSQVDHKNYRDTQIVHTLLNVISAGGRTVPELETNEEGEVIVNEDGHPVLKGTEEPWRDIPWEQAYKKIKNLTQDKDDPTKFLDIGPVYNQAQAAGVINQLATSKELYQTVDGLKDDIRVEGTKAISEWLYGRPEYTQGSFEGDINRTVVGGLVNGDTEIGKMLKENPDFAAKVELSATKILGELTNNFVGVPYAMQYIQDNLLHELADVGAYLANGFIINILESDVDPVDGGMNIVFERPKEEYLKNLVEQQQQQGPAPPPYGGTHWGPGFGL